ncbi:unnamed protein product [Diplocarpon coronariae]|uniref:Uncharacterized protein n=1 Tax=Diplocarpon coronariae TaxID=2795749 RepID=A0A218Z4K4_9HELO|nr:hypothetical protein B2J93_9504 [Marssonina coronariae]
MAFRQPTFHASQRVYVAPAEPQTQTQPSLPSEIAENQEWVLFSPSAASATDGGDTFTAPTRTAGHSQLSDLGSLDTAARSSDFEEGSEDPVEEDDDDNDDDGELDTLDSYLHAFRRECSVYRGSAEAGGAVLPTHDGLGSFRLHETNMGEDVQDHLYAFERFNPRRVKRRRDSAELGRGIWEEEGAEAERTRIRRVEKWRMEQSRLLVDEIQKETRRRKYSMSSEKKKTTEDRGGEDLATLSHVENEPSDEESDGLWNRITKKVIRDLMGIDDDLLAIIFGGSLPEDDDLSTTPPATSAMEHKEPDEFSWQHRLLKRVARELGVLISQLSEDPGAFTTYLQWQETPLPYAALPVVTETRQHPNLQASTITGSPQFHPTLPAEAASIAIPSTSLASQTRDEDAPPGAEKPLSQVLTREDWERDLDIKMVFRYLRTRFTSKFKSTLFSPADAEFPTSSTSHLATASTADHVARAGQVQRYHPLVQQSVEGRNSTDRRTWRASVPGSPLARRGSSSCASERLSGNGRAGMRKSASSVSRPYWDFGGQSVGSGSLIASTGAMGSWGEV